MTEAEALIVNKATIVDMMTRNAPFKLKRHLLNNQIVGLQSHLLESRITDPIIVRDGQQQSYQQMISTPKS